MPGFALSPARLFGTRGPAPQQRLSDMIEIARQRRALARLDDAALDDMGLTRAEAEAEARRVAWDAPAHWSCLPRRKR